jgi:ATP-dependent DNA helicase RecQ
MIFHDSTLLEIITSKPNSLDTFSNIGGVGQKKLDKYAEEFMAVLKKFSH